MCCYDESLADAYRLVKGNEMSIADASVKWFLQLTTATALSGINASPLYRDLILKQTRSVYSSPGGLSCSLRVCDYDLTKNFANNMG